MNQQNDTRALHRMSPTERFSDRAREYTHHRPSYPQEAITCILEGLDSTSPGFLAADIGAGTGISARLLSDRGVRVIAIEPNEQMRAAGDAQNDVRITWRRATAEVTGLESDSINLIVCAQAFHWFRDDDAAMEMSRILKPGARLAIMWNDKYLPDQATMAYTRAVLRASNRNPAAERPCRPDALCVSDDFVNFRLNEFEYQQRHTCEGLIGRALSASYVPRSGPEHARLVTELTAAHARYADSHGDFVMRYTTRVYLAEKAC
jgi:SAM-dependent methyltransferase